MNFGFNNLFLNTVSTVFAVVVCEYNFSSHDFLVGKVLRFSARRLIQIL